MSYSFSSSLLGRRNYSTTHLSGTNESQYLTDLSEPLYDHVRPRIIHEPQILALSELCLLFQNQFMRDPDEGNSIRRSN